MREAGAFGGAEGVSSADRNGTSDRDACAPGGAEPDRRPAGLCGALRGCCGVAAGLKMPSDLGLRDCGAISENIALAYARGGGRERLSAGLLRGSAGLLRG